VITIDPKTIDLVWELHADLDSKVPVNIVSGYRSAKTNSALKRMGRNVAKKSQHIQGRAIDIFFPDVPTLRMRNSALVRKVGGVGYYRASGGPTGFLHVDSGRVRHWGPGIDAREMAAIFRDYRKTVGARLNREDQMLLAEASSNAPSQQAGKAKAEAEAAKAVAEAAYEVDDEELAELSEEASQTPRAPAPKLQENTTAEAIVAEVIPKPRPKPIEVLMMAAVNMKIEPASAMASSLVVKQNSPVGDSIGAVEAAETMAEITLYDSITNTEGKGDLASALRDGTAPDVPVIKTITTASAAGADLFWWPRQIIFDSDQAVRRDGAPRPFAETVTGILPGSAEAAEMPQTASGKGDLLSVNRQGKGSLPGVFFSSQN
ncbi:MAG: YcbK family protein, partial [Methylocella sp.]